MTSRVVDHWVTSPYCFCKDLPWLSLSGLATSPSVVGGGGWGWDDWAVLAAVLAALLFLLCLLLPLLCLLWPAGLCCGCCKGRGCASCCGGGACGKGAASAGKKDKGSVEMSSLGGSAGDLKLPRAWMDSSKGDMTDERGDLGVGGAFFNQHKTWSSAERAGSGAMLGSGIMNGSGVMNGRGAMNGSGVMNGRGVMSESGVISRSENLGVTQRRSGHGRYDVDSVDGDMSRSKGQEGDSSRNEFYTRNESTNITVVTPSRIGEQIREAVQDWLHRTGLVSRKLEETRQTQNEVDTYPSRSKHIRNGSDIYRSSSSRQVRNECDNYRVSSGPSQNDGNSLRGSSRQSWNDGIMADRMSVARSGGSFRGSTRSRSFEALDRSSMHETSSRTGGGGLDNLGYSSLQDLTQESRYEEDRKLSSMALVKSSASSTGGTGNSMSVSGESGVSPVVQCYTVTKKTTTTTYGDEEGDEETSVVTTTEKKWREGMKEVGEISVGAAASAGELLPAIGAPAHVLNDVTGNVRTVKSLTNVEGGASNVVRRYQYQQQSANNYSNYNNYDNYDTHTFL